MLETDIKKIFAAAGSKETEFVTLAMILSDSADQKLHARFYITTNAPRLDGNFRAHISQWPHSPHTTLYGRLLVSRRRMSPESREVDWDVLALRDDDRQITRNSSNSDRLKKEFDEVLKGLAERKQWDTQTLACRIWDNFMDLAKAVSRARRLRHVFLSDSVICSFSMRTGRVGSLSLRTERRRKKAPTSTQAATLATASPAKQRQGV